MIDLDRHRVERLIPDPAETTLAEQLAGFDPGALGEVAGLRTRPYLFTNFAVTVDGRASIDGVSGSIGSDTDTAMLAGLRGTPDAVMVGAGTLRSERYGRIIRDPAKREARVARGLSADPLAVVVSGRLELPWDIDLFTDGAGRVVVFTASADEAPETKTPLEVVRHPDGIDMAAAAAHLRTELGVRSVLCEGGPTLHGTLLAAGLVDELFITRGPMIGGGDGPGIAEGLHDRGEATELELLWLLRNGSELFARYGVTR